MNRILHLIIFLILWYLACFNVFVYKETRVGESPQLRSRLGTILSHSSDAGGEEHVYCYYPQGDTIYGNKAGEYFIKRVESLNECNSWFGAVIFHEGWWVSEREKIWWSDKQKLGEDLARVNTKPYSI